MATTTTAFTLLGKPFPFIGIGVPAAQYITWIPSAELIFKVEDGAVVVAAAGADQILVIECPLPRTFCYVLVECSMSLRGATIDDWRQAASCVLIDSSASDEKTAMRVVLENEKLANANTADFLRTYQVKNPPAKLVIPRFSDDALFNVTLFDPVIDGALASLDFYARFLRYDRNQAQYWQVNTPVLVR